MDWATERHCNITVYNRHLPEHLRALFLTNDENKNTSYEFVAYNLRGVTGRSAAWRRTVVWRNNGPWKTDNNSVGPVHLGVPSAEAVVQLSAENRVKNRLVLVLASVVVAVGLTCWTL